MKKLTLFLIIFLFPAIVNADTLYLTSGQKIEGEILNKTSEYIKIDFYGVELTYFLDMIDHVVEKNIQADTSASQKALIKALEYLEYSPEIISEAVEYLSRIYNKIQIESTSNIYVLKENLQNSIHVIHQDIFGDDEKGIYPKHFKLFSLLTDKDIGGFLEDVFTGKTKFSASQRGIALLNSTIECPYISYLGYIMLTAKGLNVKNIGVNGEDFDKHKQLRYSTFFSDFGHVSCMVIIDDQFLIADYTIKKVLGPFKFNDVYAKVNKGLFALNPSIQSGDLFNLYSKIYLLKQSGSLPVIYYNLGTFYEQEWEDFDKAIEYYNKATALDSEFASAYHNLGSIYLKKQDYNKSIEYHNKALLIRPDYAWTYYNLGLSYYLQGDKISAFEQLEKIQKLNKNDIADKLRQIMRQ